MSLYDITLKDLHDYYIENGWHGSAELIVKQGEEISKRKIKEFEKKRTLIICSRCKTMTSKAICPNCGGLIY